MIINKEDIGIKFIEGKFIVCNKWVRNKLTSLYPHNANFDYQIYIIRNLRSVYCFDSYEQLLDDPVLFPKLWKW